MKIRMSVRVNGESFEVEADGVLRLNNMGIKSIAEIEGLDALTNLIELDLTENQITKIEGLDNLSNLQWLVLEDNQITKIQGLDALGNLEQLDLRGNRISKIEGLDNLINLQGLSLLENQITRIEGLDKLVNLEEIDLCFPPGMNRSRENEIAWPAGLSFRSSAREIVRYCKQEKEKEQARTCKLRKLIQVSKKVNISRMAQILGIDEAILNERIVDWAMEYGFTIDGNFVDFEGGRKDDFIASLDNSGIKKEDTNVPEEVVSFQENNSETKKEDDQAGSGASTSLETVERARRKWESLMRQQARTMDTGEDIAVFKESHLCIVHKGPVDSHAFICPGCGTFYCKACYDAVAATYNTCWSCGRPLDPSRPSEGSAPEEEAGVSQGKK